MSYVGVKPIYPIIVSSNHALSCKILATTHVDVGVKDIFQ